MLAFYASYIRCAFFSKGCCTSAWLSAVHDAWSPLYHSYPVWHQSLESACLHCYAGYAHLLLNHPTLDLSLLLFVCAAGAGAAFFLYLTGAKLTKNVWPGLLTAFGCELFAASSSSARFSFDHHLLLCAGLLSPPPYGCTQFRAKCLRSITVF
jgi:hypothetical protein